MRCGFMVWCLVCSVWDIFGLGVYRFKDCKGLRFRVVGFGPDSQKQTILDICRVGFVACLGHLQVLFGMCLWELFCIF